MKVLRGIAAAAISAAVLTALVVAPPGHADLYFWQALIGRQAAAPPYVASDDVPLVRGGATYHVPGTALLSPGINDRLTIDGVTCTLGETCIVAPAASALVGSNGTALTPVAVGGGLSVVGGSLQLAPLTAISHEWLASVSSGGVPQLTQPGCGDLSDFGSACRAATGTSGHAVPFLDGNNDFSAGAQTFGTVYGSVPHLVSGTTYPLSAADCGTEIVFTNAGTVSVTTVANIVSGTKLCAIALHQEGTGTLQIVDGAAATHVSVNNSCPSGKTSGQFATMSLEIQPYNPSEYKIGGECS